MKFIMVAQFCSHELEELTQLVQRHRIFTTTFCALHMISSLISILENLFVIRALWKASSIPGNMKKLFLNLAFSDIAVALFGQLMLAVIIAVMLKMEETENYNFLCPTVVTVNRFFLFLLACASFLNVTAIAVDRLLAVSIHLRYQEFVTSKRVFITLVSLWLTSGVGAFLYILFPDNSNMIVVIIELVGILLTTVAYIRMYKVVRYHQNRIQCQLQLQNTQILQEKKSPFNSLFVYVVFLACYLPRLCSAVLLITNSLRISFLVGEHVTFFLIFLNSSLNPVVYSWRYREIRETVKRTLKTIFRKIGS